VGHCTNHIDKVDAKKHQQRASYTDRWFLETKEKKKTKNSMLTNDNNNHDGDTVVTAVSSSGDVGFGGFTENLTSNNPMELQVQGVGPVMEYHAAQEIHVGEAPFDEILRVEESETEVPVLELMSVEDVQGLSLSKDEDYDKNDNPVTRQAKAWTELAQNDTYMPEQLNWMLPTKLYQQNEKKQDKAWTEFVKADQDPVELALVRTRDEFNLSINVYHIKNTNT
jgi:hypothetical protein